MAHTNKLELFGLSGGHGEGMAIDRISLQAEPGEMLAILGPERAGKTSLIRLIAGFGQTTAGHIAFNGHDLADVAPRQRPFALLGERDALFPHLTVVKNVAYGLKAQRLDPGTIAERVKENLALIGVTGLDKFYPEQLTRAQRHRVALARALATRPLVLLLDQAFDALEPLEAGRIMMALTELQQRAGFTLIAATRDSDAALTHADRVAVMVEGRIVQIGSPITLYDRPEHPLVASLTGPVNLLAGTARAGAIDVPGLGELAADAGALAPGTPAVLSLRPEAIELWLNEPADRDIRLPVEVRDVVYSGGGLRVRLASGGIRLTARVDGRRLTSSDLPAGRRIWCTWAREAAQVMRA